MTLGFGRAFTSVPQRLLIRLAFSYTPVADQKMCACPSAIVVAMGLENSVFQIRGGGGLGLTYVTLRAGEGRPTARRGADRRRALGLGAEFAAMGGDGDGFPVRCARLLLDQSRGDLVCRRRSAGIKCDPGRDNPPIALTANAACPI